MISDELQRLKEFISLSSEISSINDLDILMEKILKSARDFVGCDAGSIYIKKENRLEFSYSQNDTLQKLEPHKKLVYSTYTIPINNKSIAGYAALSGETINTPDVEYLDASVPYRFNPGLDERSYYKTGSVLTVPLKTSINEIIGVLQLINKLDAEENVEPFSPEVEPYVGYFASIAATTLERALLTRNVVLRMIKIIELRDPKETGNHVHRVAGYSLEIYETLAKSKGVPQNEILHIRDILHMAAMLHDIGKTAISDFILKKPGKLTSDEFEVIKQHTVAGANILDNPFSEYEKAAQLVALNHHERFDGNGYPGHIDPNTGEPIEGYTDDQGRPLPKKGEEIPLLGRIVSIADVYDALSFSRVYKGAWEQDQVLSMIWDERGKQFDPDIVDAFFESLLMIRAIADRYPE